MRAAPPRRDRPQSSQELGGRHSAGPGRWVTAPLAWRGGNGLLPQRPLIPRGQESILAVIESEYPRARSRTWLFPSPRAGSPERRDTTGPRPGWERTASRNRLARSLSISSPLSNLLCGLEKHRCRMVNLDKARHSPSSHAGHPDTAPHPGRPPHPGLHALCYPCRSCPSLITAVNTGQRPLRGRELFGSRLKTVSPSGQMPRSTSRCHDRVETVGMPEAPGQARLRLEFGHGSDSGPLEKESPDW